MVIPARATPAARSCAASSLSCPALSRGDSDVILRDTQESTRRRLTLSAGSSLIPGSLALGDTLFFPSLKVTCPDFDDIFLHKFPQ